MNEFVTNSANSMNRLHRMNLAVIGMSDFGDIVDQEAASNLKELDLQSERTDAEFAALVGRIEEAFSIEKAGGSPDGSTADVERSQRGQGGPAKKARPDVESDGSEPLFQQWNFE